MVWARRIRLTIVLAGLFVILWGTVALEVVERAIAAFAYPGIVLDGFPCRIPDLRLLAAKVHTPFPPTASFSLFVG